MAKIYRYNQEGVGKTIQLGRRGAKVVTDGSDGKILRFEDHAASKVFKLNFGSADAVGPASQIATLKDIQDHINGLGNKKSVQYVQETDFTGWVQQSDGLVVATGIPFSSDERVRNTSDEWVINSVQVSLDVKFYDSVTKAEIADMTPYWGTDKFYQVSDRILLKAQPDPKENGIYIRKVSNDGLTHWIERAEDFNSTTNVDGAYIFVESTSQGFITDIDDANGGVIGLDTIGFAQFTGPGGIVGGAGLIVDSGSIEFALSELTSTGAAAYEDRVLVFDPTDNAHRTRSLLDLLHDDLGIYSFKMTSGDDNNGVFVAADESNTAKGSVVLKANGGITNGRVNTVTLSETEFKVDLADTVIAGTTGASINLLAGNGHTAKGGNINITAGDGGSVDNAASNGGDVTIKAGSGTVAARKGIVKIGSPVFVIPRGAIAARPTGVEVNAGGLDGGVIRVVTDAITGQDAIEFYDHQRAGWFLASGTPWKLSDLDGNTSITVATGSGANTDDIIRMQVANQGGGSTEVIKLQQSELRFQSADGTVTGQAGGNILFSTGGAIDANSGSFTVRTGAPTDVGLASGNITLSTGQYVDTDTDSGLIDITTGSAGRHSGSITISTLSAGQSTAGGVSGDIFITTGNTGNTGAGVAGGDSGTIYINAGNKDDAISGRIELGTETQTIQIGNNAVAGGSTELNGKEISIGSDADTNSVVIAGQSVTILGGTTGGTSDSITMNADTITIGDLAHTVDINIGNIASPVDITTKKQTVTSEEQIDVTAKNDNNIVFTTTNDGTLKVGNGAYNPDADEDLVHRQFVRESIEDATLGGVGRRIIDNVSTTLNTDSTASFDTGISLPAGARVTNITITVSSAYNDNALFSISAGSTILATRYDTDLSVQSIYRVEHSGTTVTAGNIIIDSKLEDGTAGPAFNTLGAGQISILVEFINA